MTLIDTFSTYFRSEVVPSIALDLGGAHTRVYSTDTRSVTVEPSVLSHSFVKKCFTALGDDGANNLSHLVTPLCGNCNAEYESAITFLKPLIKKRRKLFLSPLVLVCAPSDTLERERALLSQALIEAGASHVSIIPEVWAAALGAGLDVTHPSAQLLIDIGDSVTDLAVFRDGKIVFASAIRVACSDLKDVIYQDVRKRYACDLYPRDCEMLLNEMAAVLDGVKTSETIITVTGYNVSKKCDVQCSLTRSDIVSLLSPVMEKLLAMINLRLKTMSAELYSEVVDTGIVLTGGGACIKGIDRVIHAKTQIETRIAQDSLNAVINGASEILEFWKGKKEWWKNIEWPEWETMSV
jgi:rod shape-determining protein MreB